VTPLLAMLHSLAETGSARPMWWIHGAQNSTEHPFAEEASSLLKQLPRAHAHVSYSRPRESDRAGIDYTVSGRLSADVFGALGLPRNAEAYLCGPKSFMEDLSAALADYGLDRDHIHVEAFGAGAPLTRASQRRSSRRTHPAAPSAQADCGFRPQRPDGAMASALRQPARFRRGLRRADPMVLPHRCLPQLRDSAAVGDGQLRSRPGRAAGRG
jgi:Oxidoreductase NAD-binding domain